MTSPGLVRFLVRRSARAVLTLAGVAAVVFLLMSAAPGDPASLALRARGGQAALSQEALRAFRVEYGLDRPLAVRFAAWLGRAATLDFGRSLQDGRDVRARIAESLPVSLAINVPALLLALLVAVPAGTLAARWPGGRFDRVSGVCLDLLFAAPPFVVGLVLLLVFAVRLGAFPILGGTDEGLRGLVLPVVTLSLAAAAPAASVVRSVVREALASTPAVAGRARGEGPADETRRALRRSAAPLAALGAALLPVSVAGSVLVERLFSLRGTGALLADAVFTRDTPTVLGLTFLAAVVVVTGSVAADLAAAAFDPRVAAGEGPTAGADA